LTVIAARGGIAVSLWRNADQRAGAPARIALLVELPRSRPSSGNWASEVFSELQSGAFQGARSSGAARGLWNRCIMPRAPVFKSPSNFTHLSIGVGTLGMSRRHRQFDGTCRACADASG